MLKLYKELPTEPACTVRVVNVYVPFAHGLVHGHMKAGDTGMLVENRRCAPPGCMTPGSWLIVRSCDMRGWCRQPSLLAPLRTSWTGMPDLNDMASGAYVGAVRFKESRPGADPTLQDCELANHGEGDYCWLFDKWLMACVQSHVSL